MQRNAEELSLVKDLLRAHPQGMSITDIAEKLGKNKHSVGRYLDILHASGHVDLRTFGMAKVYTLSSRVPLSALLSYTTDLVLVVDTNLRIIQINDTFLSLIGLKKEQVIFQDILYLPAPDPVVLSFLTDLAGRIKLQKDTDEIELHTDPKQFFYLQVIPTVFDDGTSGTTAICKDITTERRAITEMREANEFFNDLIENLTDGIIVAEKDDIIFINDRFVEITGYTKEEIAVMKPCDIAAEGERERFNCRYRAMEEKPSSLQDFSFWAERKDGEFRYLNVRMSEVWYGEKLRYYVLISDMTEQRVRVEQENLQWTIMRRVVDQISHPIYCYHADGTFFLVNESFCKIYGFSCLDDMMGKRLQDIFSNDISTSFTAGDDQLIMKGGNDLQSVLVPGPDGLVSYPVEKSAVHVGESGGTYIFGIILTNCAGFPSELKMFMP
jgi:PAS domain S-box-containing protein